MREHPLLMQGPLVRATLAGLKTQTRRPIKSQGLGYSSSWAARCPLGQAGDRLWVRETFAIVHPCRDCEAGYVDDIKQPSVIPKDNAGGYWVPWYRSDWKGDDDTERGFQWTPSIHMPRWACRLVLPLVSVRVERVQDITEADAKAEGVERISAGPGWECWMGYGPSSSCKTARDSFRSLWISIYGEASWDANPWVWVAEWDHVEVSN